jgi:hypothetical protein
MLGFSGKYRLEQRLGGGGMAEVFLGSTMGAEGFQRRVAIKRVLPGYSDNPAFAQMFIAEARISSQLVHPNIVSVVDFDRDGENRLFLVMELVDGKDLDALASSGGPLPVPVIIFVITEVLRGLGFAHDLPTGSGMRGIVHRDVSPHNVLLSWEGAVKVSDFGIAKARTASNATASEFVKGKPAYMSPEQANGESLDGRSDLFAVGVMMWEMLVGRRLFVAEDTRATLAAVLFGQIPRPRSLRGDIPKDVERVVMKLLERDVPARFASADDAVRALLECEDAPKAGRELLVETLAQRFPGQARVRQSRAGQPGYATPPAGVYTPGHPQPAAAMPSIGSMRNAETRVQRSSKLLAILIIALVGSAAAAFGIVKLVRSRKATTQVASAPIVVDAAPLEIDAAPAVIDAAAAPPEDAKKDATPIQPAHPAKYGYLNVLADPARTVYVDSKHYGDTPITIKLAIGKHRVRLENVPNHINEPLSITINENQTMKINRR